MGNLAHNAVRFRKSDGVITGSTITPSFTLSLPTRTGPDDKMWAAPCQVICEATATIGSATQYPFHELFYVWDFGDGSSGTWTYGAKGNAGVGSGQSKNVEYGPIGGHVYDTEGNYTITLTVYDINGTVATTSQTITVNNPDTCWPGSQTICISSSATANGYEPAGSTFVGNIDDLANWLDNNTGGNVRYLLRSGDSFTHGNDGFTASISSISWAGGTVTVNTTTSMPLIVGKQYYIPISGVTPTAYNGTKFCTAVTTTQLTFALASNPGAATVTGATIANVGANSGTGWTDQANIYVSTYGASGQGVGAQAVLDAQATVSQTMFNITQRYSYDVDNYKFINLKLTNSVNCQSSFSFVKTSDWSNVLQDRRMGHVLIYKVWMNNGCGSVATLGYGSGIVDCKVDWAINKSGYGSFYAEISPHTMICGNLFDNNHGGEHSTRVHAGNCSIYAHNKIVNPNKDKSIATMRSFGIPSDLTGVSTAWSANTSYSVGIQRKSTTGEGAYIVDSLPGGSTNRSGLIEPNWSSIQPGQTIVDGGVVWRCLTKLGTPWCLDARYVSFRDNYLDSAETNPSFSTAFNINPISINPTSKTGAFQLFRDYIVEDNMVVFSCQGTTRNTVLLAWAKEITVRNNIFVNTNKYSYAGNYFQFAIRSDYTTNKDIVPWLGFVWVYNNTWYIDNLAVGGPNPNQFVTATGGAQSAMIVKNNLVYAIGQVVNTYMGRLDADSPLSTVTTQSNSFNDKYLVDAGVLNPANPLFTNGSGAMNLASDFTTQSGSYARGAGQWVNNKWDFAHNARSVPVDIGAYEATN